MLCFSFLGRSRVAHFHVTRGASAFVIKRFVDFLCERQTTDKVSTLPVRDELAATCTAALLYALVTKKVTVPLGVRRRSLPVPVFLKRLAMDFLVFLMLRKVEKREKTSGTTSRVKL